MVKLRLQKGLVRDFGFAFRRSGASGPFLSLRLAERRGLIVSVGLAGGDLLGGGHGCCGSFFGGSTAARNPAQDEGGAGKVEVSGYFSAREIIFVSCDQAGGKGEQKER